MSGIKRPATDQDPDYEEVQPQQEKRQRLHEEGAKELTIRRIDRILRSQFAQERENKESEVLLIDERLNKARLMADRLRACIVASFYSRTATLGQGKSGNQSQPSIHPTVKKHMGKAPRSRTQGPPEAETHNREASVSKQEKKDGKVGINSIQKTIHATKQEDKAQTEQHVQVQGLTSRFKVKKRIIVGNLSKYIPVDKREDNDRSTHRWMVYVRGSAEEPHIDHFVDKVWFFLHPSYKPNDLVEIREHPFHLTRRGWGEFPVRVQLHFKDTRNKRVDVIHNLKLDRTYTGLQTLGSETVVDVELEKDSIGLPQPPPPEPLPVAKVPKPSECDVMLEALTAPQNDTQGGASNVMVKEEVDLSIVKSEPLDVASVSGTPEVRAGEVVTSPMSPPRPGTVTPVKMVFGALRTSPARVASPASSASTPVKEGSGWTRIQIKSEPSSPRASPVSKKGWQNITTLTSPVKSEVVSETFSPPLVIKTEPGQMILSSPTKVILAQGQRPVSQGPTQNRIGLVTGQSTSGMSLVSQNSLLRLPAVTVIQGQSQCQVLNMASSANTVTAKQQQAQQQQPTLYIRCRDNTGKVYLIPQHVLNKTSAGVTAPTVPQLTSTQVQRVSTPMGMAILSPGVATNVQSANQGNVAMGTVQALASLANSQRSNITSTASQSTSTSTPKQSSMTTTIKNAGKTATLTYVLATSAATSTTHTPTVGNHSQKVAAAHGQSLVLASTVGHGQTQNLILTTPSAQKSRPGTPLAVSKAGTTVSSRPGTPVAMGTAVSDASRSLLVSPNVAENIRIVGGSIVGSSPKASNLVLINQPTAGQQISGNQQIAKGATQSGGISLLTGLTGIRPSSTSWPKGTVVAQTPTRLPSTGVSLLNKTSPASTLCQLSPGTVLIKQEPGAQWTPRQTGATLVPGQRSRQPQLLLVPAASKPATPNIIMATTAKKPQPVPVTQKQRGASPSLLTTIGNHKVIVQLLPPQPAGPTNQIAAQASAVNLRNPLSDIIKGNLGGGDRDSVFHQVSTKKAITPTAKPIDLSRYSCQEELVRAQVRLHPVVKAGIDRSLHPYCAESEDEFLSWKLGKRRAAEDLHSITWEAVAHIGNSRGKEELPVVGSGSSLVSLLAMSSS